MTAVFRETDNLPPERYATGPLDVDITDVWLMTGLPSLTAGLALVWAPLALVVPGVLVTLITFAELARRYRR